MFDQGKADRVIKFIESLKLTEDFYGQPFILRDWQKEIVSNLFGTLNSDGTRQYKKAYISMGRKNAKSQLSAAMALYCLFAEPGYGKQIYTAAGEREQASIIYRAMRDMMLQNPTLSKYTKVLDSVKRLVYSRKNSFVQALSSESYSKHGYNPSVVIYDEVHVAPNRELWDVLKTGMGTRKDPLMIGISTAGWDKKSLCYELYDYGRKVNTGIVDDPAFYCKIFELDEKDDWKEEKNWYKANPALDDFRRLDEMRNEFRTAVQMPSYENNFRRLYLNEWTSQDVRLIPLNAWDACGDSVDLESLKGRNCYGGMDLSSTIAITAFALLFEPLNGDGVFDLLLWFWVPGENIIEKSRCDQAPYDLWQRQGLIEGTEGNVVDYSYIRAKINELGKQFMIREIGYDPWNATQLALELQNDGYLMIPVRQGFASLSAPTKELIKLTIQKKIRHGGNPVLRFMVDSLAGQTDAAGNLKPAKDKSRNRIDGVIATIIALDRASRNVPLTSVYNERGLIVLEELEKEKHIKRELNEMPEVEIETIPIDLSKCLRCKEKLTTNDQFCPNCGMRIYRSTTPQLERKE